LFSIYWVNFRLLGADPVRALAAGVRVAAEVVVVAVVQFPASVVATVMLVVPAVGYQLAAAA